MPGRGSNGSAGNRSRKGSDPAAVPVAGQTLLRGAVRHPKLGEQVAQRIVDEICDRGMQPGEMLPSEPELLAQHGVGRAALREGLRILEVHGVVKVRPGPGGGPMVAQGTTSDMANALRLHLQMRGAVYKEVLAARLAIEPIRARLAAERQEPSGMQMLNEVMTDLESASLDDDEVFRELAIRFHTALGLAADNRLVDLLTSVFLEIYNARFPPVVSVLGHSRTEVLPMYQRAAKAVIAGDGRRAERYVRDLLEQTTASLLSDPADANEPIRWH